MITQERERQVTHEGWNHLCEPAYTFEEAISIGMRDWVGMRNQFKKEV